MTNKTLLKKKIQNYLNTWEDFILEAKNKHNIPIKTYSWEGTIYVKWKMEDGIKLFECPIYPDDIDFIVKDVMFECAIDD